MPPRSAARCCRILHHQARPTTDSVWISDRQLCNAWERYLRACIVFCRRGSHVPGPLESQRRLGKRRMGALQSLPTVPSLPAWGYWPSVDPTDYDWKAPNWPGERNTSALLDTTRTWLDHWLVRSSAAEAEQCGPMDPFFVEELSLFQRKTPDFESRLDSLVEAVRTEPLESIRRDTLRLCGLLPAYAQRQDVSASDLLSVAERVRAALYSRFLNSAIGQSLSMSLYSAVIEIAATATSGSLSGRKTGFWNGLLLQISRLAADVGLARLLARVTENCAEEHVLAVSEGVLAVLRSFFSSWAAHGDQCRGIDVTDQLQRGREAIRKLRKMSASIESTVTTDMEGARRLLANASMIHSAALDNVDALETAWNAREDQINHIAVALRHWSPVEHGGLLDTATHLAREQSFVTPEARRYLSYTWLSIMAKVPGVQQAVLFDLAGYLFADMPDSESLAFHEMSCLLLWQWESRGYMTSGQRAHCLDRYRRLWCGRDSMAPAALAVALGSHRDRKTRHGFLASQVEFLRKLDRLEALPRSFALFLRRRSPRFTELAQLLSYLALMGRDKTLTIGLYEVCRLHAARKRFDAQRISGWVEMKTLRTLWLAEQNKRAGQKVRQHLSAIARRWPNQACRDVNAREFWTRSLFSRHVKSILVDPKLPTSTIWHWLDIPIDDKKVVPVLDKLRVHSSEYWDKMTPRVLEIARTVCRTSESELSTAKALRHIGRCVHFFVCVNGGKVPRKVTECLYAVLARDFCQDRPGRTTRLEWFLHLVSRNDGDEAALNCARQLDVIRARLRALRPDRRANFERV